MRIRSYARMFQVAKSHYFNPLFLRFRATPSPFAWRITVCSMELLSEVAFIRNSHLVGNYDNFAVRMLANDSTGLFETEFAANYTEPLPNHVGEIIRKFFYRNPELIGDIGHRYIGFAITFLSYPKVEPSGNLVINRALGWLDGCRVEPHQPLDKSRNHFFHLAFVLVKVIC